MSMSRTPWDAIVTAVCLLAVLAGSALWRERLIRSSRPPEVAEAWQQVRERFPMPPAMDRIPESPPALLQAVISANPFSPERQRAPQQAEAEPETAAQPQAPPEPKFVYKGRIVMGAGQRAILEETTAKKTYFLQVGQEVAGFKVLDIEETRVLLSDQRTNEEIAVSLTQLQQPKGPASGKTPER